ncbi:MAG: FAD-dependent thymidylate synthase [Candidatus Pacearchaeota archaeon]
MILKTGELADDNLSGFSGIGNFRGRRASELSSDERTILEYFFTNVDSNVYVAKDTLPVELWAMGMGQYARSNITLKERFLQLLRDMPKKDPSAKTLEEIATAIRSGTDASDLMTSHLKKAGEFIVNWGIDYGHASLRDSASVRICFEGVSQRATKFLETAREGAYQEQSTRATPFSIENLGTPFEVRRTPFEDRFQELGKKLISLYEEAKEKVITWMEKEYIDLRTDADEQIRKLSGNTNARISDKSWEKVIREKAFDVSRSLLPQNITTSLGMTLCARRFQDMLTEWQSSEFAEMRMLGKAAQAEASKIFPYLMRYGERSEFMEQIPERTRVLSSQLGKYELPRNYGHYPIESKIIAFTPDIEDWVLASILLSVEKGRTLTELKEFVSKLSTEERARIARSQFEGKNPYEVNIKTTEIGSLTFSRLYDIGAYRDLHRQRGDRQQISPYGTYLGYHMPKEISLTGQGLPEKFEKLLEEIKRLHDDLKSEGMHSAAQYAPVMANLIHHVTTMDPNQLFYQAQLRCQPAGADSYRTIALQEIRQGLKILPAFRGLISFDNKNSYLLNRLPEAIKTESKKYFEK